MVLASESHSKGSKILSVRSSVVDEERMRPGHWLASVLKSFLQSYETVGWVTGSTPGLMFSSQTSGGTKMNGNRSTQVHLQNGH